MVTENADELAVVEDRHDEGDVRAMRGAVVGVVVDDDVARLPFLAELGEAQVDAADVAGDGARLKRGRLATTRPAGVPARRRSRSRSPPTRG